MRGAELPAESAQVQVAVLGSLVSDISVRVDRVTATHETVLESSAQAIAGGKGLCQVVAAPRLGASVGVTGRVGNDMLSDYLLDVLRAEGIVHDEVTRDPEGAHLGIPTLTPDGSNRIVGVPSASFHPSPADVAAGEGLLATADALLVHGETSPDSIHAAISATSPNWLVVWNPVPARFSLERMLAEHGRHHISWLTPNEAEASALIGLTLIDVDSAHEAARHIGEGAEESSVVVTLASDGAVTRDQKGHSYVAAPFAVDIVDPTDAGDTVTAVFAPGIAAYRSAPEALSFASAAGALTASASGAVASTPALEQVRGLVERGTNA